MMYAIRNKKTKKWLFGTDRRYFPPHQRTADDRVLIFSDRKCAEIEMTSRRCNKNYEIVAVRVEEENE